METNFTSNRENYDFGFIEKKYKLNFQEVLIAEKILDRSLNRIDLAILSALWSEHCSYKSTKFFLKEFRKTYNSKVLSSMGENSGVLDLGLNEKITFKIESHNHPSYIEPFHGASTGVGGILRDILSMGARPIGLANFIAFSDSESSKMKSLQSGVIDGLTFYGNCVGVPTIHGKTEFNLRYEQNILVNAFAIGYFETPKVASNACSKPLSRILYVGAKTGRDGIHGASMSSESLKSYKENNQDKNGFSTIQVGDPFYGKKLIEATLAVLPFVESIQDMGAAGLISSAFEMSANCGYGFKIDLDKIPVRFTDITCEEILLSESQERMLITVNENNVENVAKVMSFYDLCCEDIGLVGFDSFIELKYKNEICFKGSPEQIISADIQKKWPFKDIKSLFNSNLNIFKNKLKAQYDLKAVYEQFDSSVGCRTVVANEMDIGFLVLDQSQRGVSICIGGSSEILSANFPLGVLDCFFRPLLKLSCKGAKAVGATNCLNFGSPKNVTVMSELVFAIKQLAQICEKLQVPMISGNVSLNNSSFDTEVLSTPVVALVGLRDSVDRIPKDILQNENNKILHLRWILGEEFDECIENGKVFSDIIYRISQKYFPISAKVLGLQEKSACVYNSFFYEVRFEFENKVDVQEFINCNKGLLFQYWWTDEVL